MDLEPLLLFTPVLAQDDARLQLEAGAWPVTHSRHISTRRETGLRKRAAFPMPELPVDRRPVGLVPLSRVAVLVQLRTRALTGPGVRADVLLELLLQKDNPVRASELTFLGYSKLSVGRVLQDLSGAGFVTTTRVGNALEHRLRDPSPIQRMLGTDGLVWPDWWAVFHVLKALIALEALQPEMSPGVLRVRANTIRKGLTPYAQRLRSAPMPITESNPSAAQDLLRWGQEFTRSALGDPAFGRAFSTG